MFDIQQEGRSQRSAPQRRHMAHLRQCSRCTPRKPSGWDEGGDKTRCPTKVECACQPPGHQTCLDLGRAQNTGPTESVPLWSTQEPEPEQLRSGDCKQPRAHFRKFPCRAIWSLSSVDQKAHTPWVVANAAWPRHCKHSSHTPVIFVCSVSPSLQHNWTSKPK